MSNRLKDALSQCVCPAREDSPRSGRSLAMYLAISVGMYIRINDTPPLGGMAEWSTALGGVSGFARRRAGSIPEVAGRILRYAKNSPTRDYFRRWLVTS